MLLNLLSKLITCKQTVEEKASIKLSCYYWDEWTSSRFNRRINPIVSMTAEEFRKSEWSRNGKINKPKINNYTACRTDLNSGDYIVIYANKMEDE